MSVAIKKIRSALSLNGLDSLLVSSAANITYLTDYPSRDSWLLVGRKDNVYFTDARYLAEANHLLKGCFIKAVKGPPFKVVAQTCLEFGLKKVGFEERQLSYAEHKMISRYLSKGITFIPTHSYVEELRVVKSAQEIVKIKIAAKIAKKALRDIRGFLTAGRSEIEVAAELQRSIRYHGGYRSAFEVIVASGPNSSYPHHLSSKRKLKENEVVLIDIGVDYQGYKSDLTRVFFVGRMDSLGRQVCAVVKEAQGLALKKALPGAAASLVDKAARRYIASCGFGEYFVHNTGHGIGLEVHEAPQISSNSTDLLQEGMVFTVEPAVYLPGRFGVRIEDMVLITKTSSEVI